ncbi:hypothetical protein [Nocardioides pacificus]
MSSLPTHLPTPMQIRELLAGLLDKPVTLTPGVPLAPGPKTPVSIAAFVDDMLRVTGVIVCDLKMSAYLGAALGLVPVKQAESVIAAGALDETIAENLYEALNIAASIFNVENAGHVRLYGMHPAGDPIPHDMLVRALTLGRREDVVLDIPGYGSGRLSVILS